MKITDITKTFTPFKEVKDGTVILDDGQFYLKIWPKEGYNVVDLDEYELWIIEDDKLVQEYDSDLRIQKRN